MYLALFLDLGCNTIFASLQYISGPCTYLLHSYLCQAFNLNPCNCLQTYMYGMVWCLSQEYNECVENRALRTCTYDIIAVAYKL